MDFVTTNLETILALVVGLIALLRATAWGRGKAQALDAVTEAVEAVDAKEVKRRVAAREVNLGTAVRRLLKSSIQEAKHQVNARKGETLRRAGYGLLNALSGRR